MTVGGVIPLYLEGARSSELVLAHWWQAALL